MTDAIHPAPDRFTAEQLASDPILHFFHYAHLPETLQGASKPFCNLAQYIIDTIPRNFERTVALRKLLEAKDSAVRANVASPTLGMSGSPRPLPNIGEPVESGGFDPDRDGPIPFSD